MPSQFQIKSQMHTLQRKAEQQINTEVRKTGQKFEREIDKWVRDTNRKLQSASRPTVSYQAAEERTLGAVATEAERQAAAHPERRDVFLCHAWEDRRGVAKELHDLLERFGVRVWFSEKDVSLGTSLVRAIDKGLRMSHIGIVLATPNFLKSLAAEGIADKEL